MGGLILHDLSAIQEILPHRSPFLFVDRVTGFFREERALFAEKDILPEEPFLLGHFPGRPIMPGVLVSEALAQTSGLLIGLLRRDGLLPIHQGSVGFFLANLNMKYLAPAMPGETLLLESLLEKAYGRLFLFRVSARARDRRIASGTLSLAEEVPEPPETPPPARLRKGRS